MYSKCNEIKKNMNIKTQATGQQKSDPVTQIVLMLLLSCQKLWRTVITVNIRWVLLKTRMQVLLFKWHLSQYRKLNHPVKGDSLQRYKYLFPEKWSKGVPTGLCLSTESKGTLVLAARCHSSPPFTSSCLTWTVIRKDAPAAWLRPRRHASVFVTVKQQQTATCPWSQLIRL